MADAAGEGSIKALTGYGRYWLLALLAAITAAIGANLLIRLPLGQVVDVVLALVLVGLALAEIYFLFRAVGFVVTSRMSEALIWLGAMVVYVLLVFAPTLAFDGYAWATGQQIAGTARIYDSIHGAIAAVLRLPAQLIAGVLSLVLRAGTTYGNNVAECRAWLEVAANAFSIVIALQTLLAARRHRRESEAH